VIGVTATNGLKWCTFTKVIVKWNQGGKENLFVTPCPNIFDPVWKPSSRFW